MHIANGIKKSRAINFINLSKNSIKNNGAKVLVDAVKLNSSLTGLLLRFNNIDNGFIVEINEKTAANASEHRRRKMPEYQREIRAMAIDDGLVEDLEWQSEEARRQYLLVQDEINSQRELFQRLILEENEKYENLRREYDEAVEERTRIDQEIDEIDDISREFLKRSESCMLEANHRLRRVNSSISEIENNCISSNIPHSDHDKERVEDEFEQ